MTSTTTTYYHSLHRPAPAPSSSTTASSSTSSSRNYSSSKYSAYSSSSPSSSSSSSNSGSPCSKYSHRLYTSSLLPPSSSSPSSSSYQYKTRSSYDLNNYHRPPSSSTAANNCSSSSYLSSSYSSTYSPKSSYLASKFSGVTSSPSSSSTTPLSTLSNYSSSPSSTVTLTRFNHRRSSFDYGHDDDNSCGGDTSSLKLPVTGLSNLGNTCYMNSVLQTLYATKSFRDFIMNGHEIGHLYSALSRLFKEMSSTNRCGYVNPSQFRSTFIQMESKFNGCEQQDAQEFLSYVINDLHEELNKTRIKSRSNQMIEPKSSQEAWSIYRDRYNNTKLIDIFVGQYASVIKCSHCGNESTCWDPFWDLPLPVPTRSRIDIDECIAEFTAAEILDGNEQPYCCRCKQHRKSTKRLSIVRSPKILVIHLKKFSNNGYKLSSDITVNQQIRIDNGSSSSMVTYELYGCVCHHGYSSRSGHYTAYCQYNNNNNNHWYHCDDQKVRDCTDSFSMATLRDAYVLFYKQSDHHHYTSSSTRYSSRL